MPKSKTIVDTVLKRLEGKRKPERTKRTLVLTKSLYDKFEKLCREEDLYPSDVIDEFIRVFVEQKGK